MNTVWRKILEYPQYEVNNRGCIRNKKTKRVLSTWLNNNGYCLVHLQKDNKQTNKLVHRLVAKQFFPNPLNKPQVNHRDFNKQNNNTENLEWVTISENNIHALKNGKLKSGEKSHFSKLTKKQVIQIRKEWTPKRGHTQELAKKYIISPEMIRRIIKKLNWRYI